MHNDDFHSLPEAGDIEKTAEKLKAISHPLRLKILCNLAGSEMTVHSIMECTGTTQSNISQHLGHLRDKGIVDSRRDANRVFYRVGDTRILSMIGMMKEIYCESL